jgi:hypothetical protein
VTGTTTRQCYCGQRFSVPTVPGRPKRYHSPACARLISDLHGPAAAAAHFDAMAREWIAVGPDGNPDYKKIAAELRAQARRLREAG